MGKQTALYCALNVHLPKFLVSLRLILFYGELYRDNMKADEERIFRAHRKRLAREAEALVAEQAGVEQPFTLSSPPPSPVPTMDENAKLIREEPQNKPETR